jgi:N-acetylmuramoyl-L-alanine amidase
VNVKAPCDRAFLREPLDGHRPPGTVKWIVLHDTEGGTAESVARFFEHNSSSYTHLVVDDQECYRSLTNTAIPRGAPGANHAGFHIEQCGFASWSLVIWLKHRMTMERAAYKTALHCKVFGVPPRFVEAAGLRAGDEGVTTHSECTKAFGGDHTDPGPFWPRFWFMSRVRSYYNEGL